MKELKLLVFEMRNNNLYPIGMLQDYISLTYSPNFKDSGSFILNIPFTKDDFELVMKQSDKEKIVLLEDGYLGICHKVQCKQNPKSKTIKIQGTLAEGLLDNAIVTQIIQIFEDTTANTLLTQMFFADPDETDYFSRSIWPAIIYDSEVSSEKTVHTGFQSGYCSLLRFIKDVCNHCDTGFRVKYNQNSNILNLSVIDYVDRSVSQNTNPAVIISNKTGSLYESEFSINSQAYKNFIQVYGSFKRNGTEYPIVIGQGYGVISYPTAIPPAERRCAMYDVGIVDVPNNTSSSAIQALFKTQAKELLYEANLIKSYKCKLIEAESSFKFGSDYFLGDNVTIIDTDIGLQMDAQLVEYTKTYSQNGETFEPIFGISQPTLNRVLKQKGVI